MTRCWSCSCCCCCSSGGSSISILMCLLLAHLCPSILKPNLHHKRKKHNIHWLVLWTDAISFKGMSKYVLKWPYNRKTLREMHFAHQQYGLLVVFSLFIPCIFRKYSTKHFNRKEIFRDIGGDRVFVPLIYSGVWNTWNHNKCTVFPLC